MCRNCYKSLDTMYENDDPHTLQHYVFLIIDDPFEHQQCIQKAIVPCNIRVRVIQQYVATLHNVMIKDYGISPKLRLRIIMLGPTLPVIGFDAYKTELTRQINTNYQLIA